MHFINGGLCSWSSQLNLLRIVFALSDTRSAPIKILYQSSDSFGNGSRDDLHKKDKDTRTSDIAIYCIRDHCR